MSEYCPTCFRKLPIPGAIGTFLTDPILTPNGLSGDKYKGFSFIRSLYKEASTYYHISTITINSSYYNREAIKPQHMVTSTHQQIEQKRINIENIMFYLGFPLAFYFQKDYKGDDTGLIKTEWSDVNRVTELEYEKMTGKNPHHVYQNILNGTIPLLPPKQKIRAIHIEELRISIYFQRIIETFEIGNYYQCPIDNEIYHKDYVLIKANDVKYYCPNHTDEILIGKEEANINYHKETFTGYEPSIITGDNQARVCGQQSNFHVTASGNAGSFYAIGNVISSIKQQGGLVKTTVEVDTTIENIDFSFYSTSYGYITMNDYGQNRAKPVPTVTDTTMSLGGLKISGTNYQCVISLDIKLKIYKKLGDQHYQEGDYYAGDYDKTFTLVFFTDGGYKDSLRFDNIYETKEGYFVDNDGYLSFRLGSTVTKFSKIWYPIEDVKDLNLMEALKYEYPEEEEIHYVLNGEDASIGSYFIQEININTLQMTMETQNYTSKDKGINSSSSNIEFQIESFDLKSKEYNVFYQENLSSQIDGEQGVFELENIPIASSIILKLNGVELNQGSVEEPKDYFVAGNEIILTTPPSKGSSLEIEYLSES